MSRSTFTFNEYSLTGGTHVVRVVCGFLLKLLKEDSIILNETINKVIKNLEEYITTDHGFILIKLPQLNDDELNYLANSVSKTILYIQAFGTYIPIRELKGLQQEGYFLPEVEMVFINDMPTNYILDYLNQLRRMITLPLKFDLSKEQNSTSYPIDEA
jgi:hypothetical protein